MALNVLRIRLIAALAADVAYYTSILMAKQDIYIHFSSCLR